MVIAAIAILLVGPMALWSAPPSSVETGESLLADLAPWDHLPAPVTMAKAAASPTVDVALPHWEDTTNVVFLAPAFQRSFFPVPGFSPFSPFIFPFGFLPFSSPTPTFQTLGPFNNFGSTSDSASGTQPSSTQIIILIQQPQPTFFPFFSRFRI